MNNYFVKVFPYVFFISCAVLIIFAVLAISWKSEWEKKCAAQGGQPVVTSSASVCLSVENGMLTRKEIK